MADIQTYLEQFDDKIRLKRLKENKELIEKRDIILNKLRERFELMREGEDDEEGMDIPFFAFINQGSYEMGTGIHPAEGQDYDIDVGLTFNAAKADYPNPVTLKALVADALEDHTDLGTEVRKSCVTIKYKRDGEQAFHVDLAVYTYDDPKSATKRLYIAKGKVGSGDKDRYWEESDPEGLALWVEQRFKDREQEQFLRVIRALKRWKTEKFKTDGQNAPSGIGLTVAAGQWFQPNIITSDAFAARRKPDDLTAMRGFVAKLVNAFHHVGSKQDGTPLYRLEVKVPVAPWKDIFVKMTDGQMTTFRDRLIQLRDQLDKVMQQPDPVDACKLMRDQFGPEFPIPDKSSTGSKASPAIISAATSA
ncbi:nucleotidyltransferase [Corallococcus coralloides]|uniref:nucleotidyltransferase domain-containing protein n=1 Tax=Corallococcus coralloides TaxID=184914 RepID=UPI00384B64A2